MTRRTYALLGASVLTIGATTLFVSLVLVGSESGAVVAIAVLILGIVLASLGHTRSEIPPSLGLLFARAGYENTARLLEELGVRSKATYLPAAMCGGTPLAAIPVDGRTTPTGPKRRLESRLIARDGENGLFILAATPGSHSMELLDGPVGQTLDEAETALTALACGSLGLATAVHISSIENSLQVRFERHLETEPFANGAIETCLGSPLASIAATILAESMQCPVALGAETRKGDSLLVELRPREGYTQ